MQFSPLTCYLVPLSPKYSPQHPILKHPQSTSLPQCERPSFGYSTDTCSCDVQNICCVFDWLSQSSYHCQSLSFLGFTEFTWRYPSRATTPMSMQCRQINNIAGHFVAWPLIRIMEQMSVKARLAFQLTHVRACYVLQRTGPSGPCYAQGVARTSRCLATFWFDLHRVTTRYFATNHRHSVIIPTLHELHCRNL